MKKTLFIILFLPLVLVACGKPEPMAQYETPEPEIQQEAIVTPTHTIQQEPEIKQEIQPAIQQEPEAHQPEMELKAGSSGDAVFFILRENGLSTDSKEVVITNFYAGARAEMIYRIHNATGRAITPEIFIEKYADVADYSEADGAIKPPRYVLDWVELPRINDIPPGQIKEFVVAIQMPKNAEKPADKLGFLIGVAGKTEGEIQPAVGVWWLINMR